MTDLLNQFFDLWLETRRLRWDTRTHRCNRFAVNSRHFQIDRLANRIERERAATIKALPAGAHEDIPGQMYLTDLPIGTVAATTVGAKGAA